MYCTYLVKLDHPDLPLTIINSSASLRRPLYASVPTKQGFYVIYFYMSSDIEQL